MRHILYFLTVAFSVILFQHGTVNAQNQLCRQYYLQAKTLAFEQNKMEEALLLCQKALQQDSSFTDGWIFAARLYAWMQQFDTARMIIEPIIEKYPAYQDARIARVDISYWAKQYNEALYYCDDALRHFPGSTDLIIRKAKILYALKDYSSARKIVQSALQQQSDNIEARNLLKDLRGLTQNYKAGIEYNYFYFDKQFKQPWHITALEFSKLNKTAPVTGKFSYGNRFGISGWQCEAETYPRISRVFYFFINAGIAPDNNNVFPQFHAAFSLFTCIAKTWEFETGMRYLKFENSTWIYTSGAAKYIGRYWLQAKAYVSRNGSHFAQSYFLTARHYYGKSDDYISLSAGRGILPEGNQSLQLNSIYNMSSLRINMGIHHAFANNIVFFNTAWSRDEYAVKTYGNQINTAIGFQRKF